MNVRKLVVLGVLSLFGATLLATDAQAGRHKRQRNNCCPQPVSTCNTCGGSAMAYAPPCSTCGSGVAYGATGGVPYAMPMPGGSTVIPAAGTTTSPGTVIPAGGTILSDGTVIPAGSTYYPSTTGSYYFDPATGTYFQNSSYQYSTPMFSNQRRGLFRRY
jgi:hypothetical protein